MALIVWKILTMVFLVTGSVYAYRIATRPITRTWLEVVIGVALTSVLIIASMILDVIYVTGNTMQLVILLATSLIFAFAVTGVPMILGQELKRNLTKHHKDVTTHSLRATRASWRESHKRNDDSEETMAR
jgi:hypothetical protein